MNRSQEDTRVTEERGSKVTLCFDQLESPDASKNFLNISVDTETSRVEESLVKGSQIKAVKNPKITSI